MATLAIVASNTAVIQVTDVRDLLQLKGHTVNLVTETTVNASNLLGNDAILCVRNNPGQTATLAPLLEGYMTNDSIPVVVCASDLAIGGNDFDPTALAVRLGIAASVSVRTLSPGAAAFGVDFRAEAPTNGFRGDESAIYLAQEDLTVNVVPGTGIPVAGPVLLVTDEGYPLLVAARAGDARVPQVGGTFDTKVALAGFLGGTSAGTNDYQRDAAAITQALVDWLEGDHDLGFPT